MITKFSIGAHRDEVKEYVKDKRVIDVGGAMNTWLDPKPYACVDILKGECTENWRGDINMPLVWVDIVDYVDVHGKFDFAVCTHVLEDLRNPPMVLEMLPLIAKEGFISTPTKHAESNFVECGNVNTMNKMNLQTLYHGYIHHRWLFSVKINDNQPTLFMFPKLGWLEHLKGKKEEWGTTLDWVTRPGGELSVWWKDNVPYKLFQDDWLGPNPWDMAVKFQQELKEGL